MEYGGCNIADPHNCLGSALLGRVALYEWVWTCWKKYDAMGVGFEVTYVFKPCPVSHTTSSCLQDQDVILIHPFSAPSSQDVCLHTTVSCNDDTIPEGLP